MIKVMKNIKDFKFIAFKFLSLNNVEQVFLTS